jgi:adenine-specific DNA methylase
MGHKPIAYYWVKTAVCSNPSCKAEVPLLRQFYLPNTKSKQVYLKPIINGNSIEFDIIHGKTEADGWLVRANLLCPCCNNVTEVDTLKKQFYNGTTKERLVAVIWDGVDGKEYRKPTDNELKVIESIPKDIERPNELMPPNDSQNLKIPLWGYKSFGDMFSYRQLLAIQTLISKLNDFKPLVNGYESEYLLSSHYISCYSNKSHYTTYKYVGLWNVIGEK